MEYRIGKLAQVTGLSVETIRYYEQQGLVGRPSRTASNYRVYGDAHLDRLAFIHQCRSLDLSLEEILVLLRVRDERDSGCEDVSSILDQHIGHVTTRLAELKNLRRQLVELRQRCAAGGTATDCGILSEISTMARRSKPPRAQRRRKPASGHHHLRRRR